jgi:amino-acid N-acetyltransferase
MGYSPTGEVFNLSHEDVATQAAIALKADKLITLSDVEGIYKQDKLIRTIELDALKNLLDNNEISAQSTCLSAMTDAVSAGIDRAHCVSYHHNGAILKELFTRDGHGSLVMQTHYEQLRNANIDDVGGILKLIKPLEEAGILLNRSRERLENDIDQFMVIERDGMIIACAALHMFEQNQMGEIACVAIHSDYRGKNRGERLIDALQHKAVINGLKRVFVLTTVSSHWFLEQGFTEQSISELPESKKELYNFTRNSKVFVMEL